MAVNVSCTASSARSRSPSRRRASPSTGRAYRAYSSSKASRSRDAIRRSSSPSEIRPGGAAGAVARETFGRSSASSMFSVSLRSTGPLGLQEPAAVDDERRARDEAGACEVEDGIRDVVGGADAAEQGLGRAPLLLARLDGDG